MDFIEWDIASTAYSVNRWIRCAICGKSMRENDDKEKRGIKCFWNNNMDYVKLWHILIEKYYLLKHMKYYEFSEWKIHSILGELFKIKCNLK